MITIYPLSSVSPSVYGSDMVKICPNCQSTDGIREATYGMPAFEPDKQRYFAAGCTSRGQKYVCVICKWGIENDEVEEEE
jgi:hypothetical protein